MALFLVSGLVTVSGSVTLGAAQNMGVIALAPDLGITAPMASRPSLEAFGYVVLGLTGAGSIGRNSGTLA